MDGDGVPRNEFETVNRDTQRQLSDLATQAKEAVIQSRATDTKLNALAVDVGRMFGQLSLYQKVVVPLLTLVIGLVFGHFYI